MKEHTGGSIPKEMTCLPLVYSDTIFHPPFFSFSTFLTNGVILLSFYSRS